MLGLAEQQEKVNGEWSEALGLFMPGGVPGVQPRYDIMGIHAAELPEEPTKQKLRAVGPERTARIDRDDHYTSKNKEKRISELNRGRRDKRLDIYNRSRSVTPDGEADNMNAQELQRPSTSRHIHLPNAVPYPHPPQPQVDPFQPQAQQPVPQFQPPAQTPVFQFQPQAQSQPAQFLLPGQPQAAQQQRPPALKPYQPPVLMPQSMDYNNSAQEDQRNYNALLAGQIPGQNNYNRGY